MSMCRNITLLFLVSASVAFGQTNPADSLTRALETQQADSVKLQILDGLVNYYSNYDLAIAVRYAGQGLKLAEKTGAKKWMASFYHKKGRSHANSLQLDSALYCFEKAIAGYQELGDKKGQASTAFKIAWVHRRRGETEKSLQRDLAALKLYEEVDDKRGICDAYTRISQDLERQNRLKEAAAYIEKAIALADQYNLDSEVYYVNVQAGNVYIAKGEFQKSYDSYMRAFNKAVADKDSPAGMTDISVSVGNALKKLKRYPEALQKYEEAYAYAKSVNYENGYGATLANLGEVNMIMGNYHVALDYQLKTIAHMEKTHEGVNLVENYQHVSTTYEKLKDYPASLKYQRKALKLRDSLASVESDRAMTEMLTKYEAGKKEATIASQAIQLDQQQRIQWLGIGVVVLLAAFIVVGIIAFISRAKKNKLLAVKNAENELLLKEIHHRVKNNLEVVSSLLALQSAQISDANTRDAMIESQNRVNSIGIVHQKLYQGENLGAIEMKDYFLNLSESIIDTFGANGKVQLELAMDKLSVDIDTAVPLGLIVNELLTNTLKYAFREGQKGIVKISLQKRADGGLHLEVSDNGMGKSGTEGTGFGTQLISLLTKQLNGIVREDNTSGMRVSFDFKM